jgi:hypothetical protein
VGLSVGAIAGIAAGGAVLVALGLAIVGISVCVCRKMNRELKQAKRDVKPATSPPPDFSTSRSEVKPGEGPLTHVQGGAAIEMPC